MLRTLPALLSFLLLAACAGTERASLGSRDSEGPRSDAIGADAPAPPDVEASFDTQDAQRADLPSAPETSEENLVLVGASPSAGPSAGGTLVMVEGEGFTTGLRLRFGEQEAEDLFVISERFLTCTTPPGAPGWVDIVALRPDTDGAQSEARLAGAFLYEDELFVSSVEPDEGPVEGGTEIVVRGLGFTEDTVLAIGGRLAVRTESLDSTTLRAVTPPGRPGPASVSVLIHRRTTTIPNAYTYRERLELTRVEPATGRTLGGDLVVLHGRGLDRSDPALRVWFGPWEARVVEGEHDARTLLVESPPGTAGPVDLRVQTSAESLSLPGGFVYVDPGFVASGFSIHAVSPPRGSARGGEPVSLVVSALSASPTPQVFFGEQAATVLGHDAPRALVWTESPAHAPGRVTVRIVQDWKEATRDDAYEFLPAFEILGAEPAEGPAEGGTPITVRGTGFAPGARLYVGATACEEVQVVDESHITARTGPGSPGRADLRVEQGERRAVLEDAFFYESRVSALLSVEPSRGSQAGGTYLRFLGLGLPEGLSLALGDAECTGVQRLSDNEAVGFSPRAARAGSVDVRLTGPFGEQYVIPNGFTYFDPTQRGGGTWGDPIDGTVNVTVLDGATGSGLEGSFVILGSDPTTPFQGFTDDRGQITFSAPGLRGPVSLSAFKPGYTAYSVVVFDAENVTVWLNQASPPQTGTAPPSVPRPQGLVSGRVTNAEKYLLIPPGRCEDVVGAPAPQCAPCDSDADCGEEHYCVLLGDEGRVCAAPCDAERPCPGGFVCRDVLSGVPDLCVPRGGEPEIFCRQSDSSYFGGAPNPGPYYRVNQHHEYLITTNLGEIAIYCVAGANSAQTGQFLPLAMGVRRHVLVQNSEPMMGMDVTLDIPLDGELRLLFADPPRHEAGLQTPSVRGSIDLGSDGHIRLDSLGATPRYDPEAAGYRLPGQPEGFTGALYDARYVFYVTLSANSLYGTPYSTVFVDEAWPEQAESLYHRDVAGQWTQPRTGLPAEIAALWGDRDDDLFAVGVNGAVYHRSAAGWTPQPLAPGAPLRDLTGHLHESGVALWAVGDRGRALVFRGSFWQALPPPPGRPNLRAVTSDSPERMFAVDDEGGVHRYEAGEWSLLLATESDWNDLWIQDGVLWVVGDQGTVSSWDGQQWEQAPIITPANLHAVHGDAARGLFVVGEGGLTFHHDGSQWRKVPAPTSRHLRDVRVLPWGEILAVGDSGDRFFWQTGAWLPVDDGFVVHRHLERILGTQDGGLWLLGPRGFVLGPFMGFPEMLQPRAGERLGAEDWTIRWAAQGEAVPTFNQLTLAETTGYTFWTTVIDGAEWDFPMPPLEELLDMATVRPGPFRLTVTRALNPRFEIDDYGNADLSTSRRTTWSTEFVEVVAD